MTHQARGDGAASATPGSARALQRLLLRLTMWALVIGAVVGASLMLAGLYSGGGNVLATCFAAALSSGLMAAATGWLDHRGKRAAGVTGSVLVIVMFTLSMLAIWGDAIGLWGHGTEFRLIGSVLALALIAGPAVVLMSLAHRPALLWSARVGVPALGALLLCWLWEIWGQAPPRLNDLMLVLVWGVPCVIASLVNHTLDRRHWRWLGVLAVALLTADHVSMLVGNGSFMPLLMPMFWATAGSVAYANAALAADLPERAGWLRWTAIVSVVAGAYLAAWFEPWNSVVNPSDHIAFRVIAALSLVAACSTIGLVLAWRMGLSRRWTPQSEAYTSLVVTCPRCSKRQSIRLPEAPCVSCGLAFRITMFDPRCPVCGYDTAGLAAASCPECGSAVMKNPAPHAAHSAP